MSTQSAFAFPERSEPPLARASDPLASHTASRADRLTDRQRALAILARHPDGLTDHALAEIMGRQQTSAGKRRHDLVALGLVEATAERRATPSGATAIVWTVTADGLRAAREVTP